MASTENPKLDFSLLPANQAQTIAGRRDLICGQLGSTATATSGEWVQNVEALTDAEIRTKFGGNVDLVYKILNFRAGNDRNSQLDVIGVDAAGGATAGTATLQFTGTATADGTYTIYIVDGALWFYEVEIASGTVNTAIATAVSSGASALSNPVFATSVATDTVTYTSNDLGTISDHYGIKIEGSVPGVTVTVTGWTGGATDPTVTTILDPIAGTRYNGLQWPEAWDSTLISIPVTLFDSRFNSSNEILDGVVFTGKTDTFANSKAVAAAQNSQSLVFMGNNITTSAAHKGTVAMQPADWVSSYFMGVRSKRLSEESVISGDVATFSPGDAIGGIHLASLPYFNTPLRSLQVTDPDNLFTKEEQVELEEVGFTTYGVNGANNLMLMGPVVTTWTTDTQGNPNTSFLYLNYVDTGSVCREYIFNNFKSDFGQTRLTTGDLVANLSMTNPGAIKAKLLTYYKQLAEEGLTQKGTDAEAYFSQNTTVTADLETGTVTIIGPLPIVVQLRKAIYPISLSFSIS